MVLPCGFSNGPVCRQKEDTKDTRPIKESTAPCPLLQVGLQLLQVHCQTSAVRTARIIYHAEEKLILMIIIIRIITILLFMFDINIIVRVEGSLCGSRPLSHHGDSATLEQQRPHRQTGHPKLCSLCTHKTHKKGPKDCQTTNQTPALRSTSHDSDQPKGSPKFKKTQLSL